jgi:hypothetical protein
MHFFVTVRQVTELETEFFTKSRNYHEPHDTKHEFRAEYEERE